MFGSIDSARLRRAAVCLGLAGVLGACVTPYAAGPRAQVGAFTGAAAGGLLASAASGGEGDAIAAGVLLGGLLGGALGDHLDRVDRHYAAQAFQDGLEWEPSGHSSSWHNPDSGNSGSVTPTRTYETARGHCREYTQTVEIGGRSRTAYGTACRDAWGEWRVEP
ncbi:MAG: RT0821/Lpp0805 family surface protein [Myxococcota bacterium]|nr:RT0821/Lpp0805 family surface protein [Myxococcota bacterium]